MQRREADVPLGLLEVARLTDGLTVSSVASVTGESFLGAARVLMMMKKRGLLKRSAQGVYRLTLKGRRTAR